MKLKFKESQGPVESPFHKLYSINFKIQEHKLYNHGWKMKF